MDRREVIKFVIATGISVAWRPARALIGIPGGAASGGGPPAFSFVVGNSGGQSPSDYGSPPRYQDRMMESRGYMTATSLTSRVSLDASGWPTADFQTMLTETQGFTIAPNWNSGGYACGFTSKGSGTETITGLSGTVSNQSYNSGTKQVTFTLTPTSATSAFGFKVTGTTGGVTDVFAMLPAYAGNTSYNLGGGTANLFTNEFLNTIKTLPLQRGLDWSQVVYNLSNETWSLRHTSSNVKTGAIGYGGWNGNGTIGQGVDGFPMDQFVALCNLTNSHCWYHAPWYDDGTYANGMTSYALSNLTYSTQAFFAEKVNEAWNNGDGGIGGAMPTIACQFIAANPGAIDYDNAFSTTGGSGTSGANTITVSSVPSTWAVNQTINSNSPGIPQGTGISGIAGTTITLNKNLTENLSGATVAAQNATMVQRLYAYGVWQMAQQVSSAAGAKFGNQAFVVLCWQTGSVANIYGMLSYIASKLGTPSSMIHYLAIAPYMTRNNSAIPGDGVNHINSNDTIAAIQSQLTTNGSYRGFLAQSEQLLILALSYGMKGILTYECGWEIAGETTAVTNLGAAIMDSGMQSVVTNYLTALQNCGYQLLNNTSYGVVNTGSVLDPQYAMSNDPNAFVTNGSPRYNALVAFQNRPPARTRNVVSASGSSIDCINYADHSSGLGNTYIAFGGFGSFFSAQHGNAGGYIPYHIYCTRPGTYSVSAQFANTTTGTTNLECNGTVVATGVSLPNGTGTTTLGTVTLNAGENYIVLGNGATQSGVVPKSLTFT